MLHTAINRPLIELQSFKNTVEFLKKGETPLLLTGVLTSQKVQVIEAIEQKLDNKTLIITSDEKKAKEIYDDILYFKTENVYMYPGKDIIFYNADVKSIDIVSRRCKVYEALLNNESCTIVLSVEALFDRLTPKEVFSQFIMELNVGDEVDIETLATRLNLMGFARRDSVEYAGQYAIRGGILDLFTTVHDTAIRVEFWGDEIDSIRTLDEFAERSVDKLDTIKIMPVRELVFDKDRLDKAKVKIKKEYENSLANYEKKGLNEEYENLKKTFGSLYDELDYKNSISKAEVLMPYFFEEKISLLDYLDDDFIVYLDDYYRVQESANFVLNEFDESVKNRLMRGYMLPTQANLVNNFNEILHKLSSYKTVVMTSVLVDVSNLKIPIKETINYDVKTVGIFENNVAQLTEDVAHYKKLGYKTVLLTGTKVRGLNLVNEFIENKIEATYYENLNNVELQEGGVYISKGALAKGFAYPSLKFVVISDRELFGDSKKVVKKRAKNGKPIESFTDIKVGDYIVHEKHGIGIFKGIEEMVFEGITKDYFKIGYKDDGNLYVPTNQLDLIQKYIGADGATPKINKLGGIEWNKAKERTKRSVVLLAKELVELYAKRQNAKGFNFSRDNQWQRDFEDSFIYQETNDQLNAIEDVKKDMESSRVMDRLVCGDVGYGKTEVAIRAAFKAVQDGKQVAYLVPTTILAEQMYNNFKERMADFPIGIELLSRFRTPKQQKESIMRIQSGLSEILIGTHRILSKDVLYKDLGLVIVDEEQRFGVKDKEKLKHLKENVDVLTLTATPIPRTLHMSMTGIRDMSVLEEPPNERQPVQTYVCEYNEEFVREAINREIGRGGQVFYLYNRVNTIDHVAERVAQLVPNAVVNVAHGQMSERELERVMKSFIDNESNILVCTTIIETGLDISNANTIIMENADQMGLSQLYQLRGRVGRSTRSAYAYLMYKRDKVLTEVAEKRLQTIRDFTEFGSGFKVSMRDLEIRGAGTLLGEEQHGYLGNVGYEMYCKLLDEAIREMKGEEVKPKFETSIDMNITAHIPQNYIKNEVQKIEVYKKIANILTQDDYNDVQEEVEDRFGDIPKAVNNLMDIALFKAFASSVGVISVTQIGKSVKFTVVNDANIDVEKVLELSKKASNPLKLQMGTEPVITIDFKKKNISVDELFEFLESIKQES